MRYTYSDLKNLGLSIEPIPVHANTLVIADVSGVHSRGVGEDKDNDALRVALHGNARHFNVF